MYSSPLAEDTRTTEPTPEQTAAIHRLTSRYPDQELLNKILGIN